MADFTPCDLCHRDPSGSRVRIYCSGKCRPAPHIPPAQAGEATVSEAEVEAGVDVAVNCCLDTYYDRVDIVRITHSILEAAARARAAAQGAGAQPVAYAIVVDGECEEIGWGATPAPDDPSNVPLYAAPPDAPRPDIEAARREERERCAKIVVDAVLYWRSQSSHAAVALADDLELVLADIRTGDRP